MRLHRLVDAVQYLTLAAVALTVVMLFLYDPDPPAIVVPAGSGDVNALGAEVYAARCAGCHGDEGEGAYGPALASGAVVVAFPDVADQVTLITEGRDAMPGFGTQLSPEEIDAVVAFTREGLGVSASDPAPGGDESGLDGAALFADHCASCHGAEGNGGVGPQLAGGVSAVRFPDAADQEAVVAAGRNGMPGFDATLSAAEIAAVVAYARALP